jgi:hypothetical protein
VPPSHKPRLRDFLIYLWARLRTRQHVRLGGTAPGDVRHLAELERAGGDHAAPEGCAWLDETTVADLELPLVFARLDRSVTPLGAQVSWRWLVAPAQALGVLAGRERGLAWMAADPGRRAEVQAALARMAREDTAAVPYLMWGAPVRLPASLAVFRALQLGLWAALLLASWQHWLLIVAIVLLATNLLVDDRVNTGVARHARALEMLGVVLSVARTLVKRRLGPPEPLAALAAELPALAGLRRRIATLTFRDPFELSDLFRAVFLVRVVALARANDVLRRERDRLRRLVILVGEIDALAAVATLRAERDDLAAPELDASADGLTAADLRHPAIDGAVGNDLALGDDSLLLTGSNMSGKSTFLRALAVNAVLAQSLHTVWGRWRAPLYRVVAAMRVSDDTALGTSTYAAEVLSVHRLIAAADDATATTPALLVLDEPFRGTNPAARVPIVVAVLEHLAQRGVVGAATHDPEVAARLSPRFRRGFFRERLPADEDADTDAADDGFDYRLRPGVAPSTNALALLRRAGYPAALVAAAEAGLPGALTA